MKASLKARLRHVLPKGRFARSAAVLTGGTAAGQAIALLASPLLTRLYLPEDFGHLAVYASILSLLVVVGALRYPLAIPLPEDDEDAFGLLAVSLLALLFIVILVSVLLWLWGSDLVGMLNAGGLEPYLWLLPVSLLGAGLYQALSYWAIRSKAFAALAGTKLSQGIALVGTQLLLGLVYAGPVGLLAGDAVGRTAGSGTLARLALPGKRAFWARLSPAQLKANALRYRRFPIFSSGSALLNSTGLQVPALLLIGIYGPQVAGWFALTQRIIGAPMSLVGTSVSQVYLAEASRMAREDLRGLRRLFVKTAVRLFLLGVLPLAVLAAFGPWLFASVFGGDWLQAGRYIRILAPMFMIQFAVVPVSQTLNVLERQDLQLWWDAGRLALVLGALFAARALGWSDQGAILGYSAVMLVAYLALFALSYAALGRQAARASP